MTKRNKTAAKRNTAKSPIVKKSQTKVKAESKRAPANDFPVVGIGASAGGLEALEVLVKNLPPETNLAFVIIQHLDPKHRSVMASILSKHTKMRVMEIQDRMHVEPNTIYLNPPNKDVIIEKRVLKLIDPEVGRGPHLPIDLFFKSLSEDLHEKAICIVLSGTGSDGTFGLKAVKSEGGITLAQETGQARYAGMPQSAIDTGAVDLVLPVEKIPTELTKFIKHPYIKKTQKKPSDAQRFAEAAIKIFGIVRDVTGIDFSHYKQNTIQRRIERRMALNEIETVDNYVKYLKEHPPEVDLLHKDLLIKVTSFFRDTEAFRILEKEVIPDIIAHKPNGSSVRVWVPACATGEEAFSIAMLFAEAMDRSKKHLDVHIFATDIDIDAINIGRAATYADNIAAQVSADRRERFFTRVDGMYKVKKGLRETVVFATQDIIKNPPFSKLDLISCRNMLIYMDQTLQKKLMPMFHYILNAEGYLFLGSSESVGEFAELFSAINLKWKIFKRKGVLMQRRLDFPEPAGQLAPDGTKLMVPPPQTNEMLIRKLAENLILENYAPTCVLVDRKLDILYVNGRTEQFLSLPPGEPTYNIIKMAREEIRSKVTTALHKAFKDNTEITSDPVALQTGGMMATYHIIVRPVIAMASLGELALVIFGPEKPTESKGEKKKPRPAGVPNAERVRQLEIELASTKEYLQTTVEEIETSNEELKSTNEELQSTNEELQSANEELETSREELQSTNEELETMNSEMQRKVAELMQSTTDFNNLLNSMEVATLFLDNNLCIKRFTALTKELFKLIASDVGRPIADIVGKLNYPELGDDTRKVIESLNTCEKEVTTQDGRWFSVRIKPYQTTENIIDGAVITFIDVTAVRNARQEIVDSKNFAENVFAAIREPLLVLDGDLKIISANDAFFIFFHTRWQNTVGQFVYELGNGQWNIPKLRELLEDILPKNKKFDDFEVTNNFPMIGKKTMLLNARQVVRDEEQKRQILLAFEEKQ